MREFIKLFIHVKVGEKRLMKSFVLSVLPNKGHLLKIANHSFVVDEVEHDLDIYKAENFCVYNDKSINASLNPGFYEEDDYDDIVSDLIKNDWEMMTPLEDLMKDIRERVV